MQKNKKQRRILSLLILLLAVTIGFALMSTTLKVIGSAGVKSSRWNIHWDSESITETGVDPTTEAEVTGTNDDTIEFSAELELPGDFYEFTVDVINEGSIDGEFKTLTTTILDSSEEETTLPEYIHYTVTYADNNSTVPTEGDVLEAGESKTFKVRIEYDSEETTVPATTTTYTIRTQIKYEQHNGSSSEPQPTGPVSVTANKTTASVGETVTVTVSFTAAAWNLTVSGAATDTIAGYNIDGENQLVTETYTIDTSTAGVKTVTVTGDITDENEVTTDNISESISITVQ